MGITEDSYDVIQNYLIEEIKKREIHIDNSLSKIFCNFKYGKRADKMDGTVYFFNFRFLFVGTSKDGKQSLYTCECNASGYLSTQSYVYNDVDDVTINKDSITDVYIENLMKDASSACEGEAETQVLDDTIGNIICYNGREIIYEIHPFEDIKELYYLELSSDKEGRTKVKRIFNIKNIVESDGKIYISSFANKSDDTWDYNRFELSCSQKDRLIMKAKEIEAFNSKSWLGLNYIEYKTIYVRDTFKICKFGSRYRIITDQEILEEDPRYITQFELQHGNYRILEINDDIEEIIGVPYDREEFQDTNMKISNIYSPDYHFPEGYLYIVKFKNGNCGLLLEGPYLKAINNEEKHERVRSFTYIQPTEKNK